MAIDQSIPKTQHFPIAICDLKIRQIRSLVAVLMAARPISEGGYGLGRSAGYGGRSPTLVMLIKQ